MLLSPGIEDVRCHGFGNEEDIVSALVRALAVFKTAGGPLGAVPGGFDPHTPLPF